MGLGCCEEIKLEFQYRVAQSVRTNSPWTCYSIPVFIRSVTICIIIKGVISWTAGRGSDNMLSNGKLHRVAWRTRVKQTNKTWLQLMCYAPSWLCCSYSNEMKLQSMELFLESTQSLWRNGRPGVCEEKGELILSYMMCSYKYVASKWMQL